MSRLLASCAALFVLVTACAGAAADKSDSLGGVAEGQHARRSASKLVEGEDYVVLERVRILDEMGFDQPVEAMCVLLPRGWKTEGGVRWKSVNECRGEIVTWQMKARTDFRGAEVSDVREDETLRAVLDKMNAQANATSRQYGRGLNQTGTGVYGTLTWPDGKKGLANIGVSVSEKRGVDYFGKPNGFATTTVFHQVYIRYPAEREAEAIELFGTVTTSHRMNPVATGQRGISHTTRQHRTRGSRSRPDGSIILTNSSLFDPAARLQQNWERMEKVKR